MNDYHFHLILAPLCLMGSTLLPRHGFRAGFMVALSIIHLLQAIFYT